MEAKVTCVCNRILIADLDLTLRRGEPPLYLEAGRAKASKDLQRAWRNKAVDIRFVQRFEEKRPAPVPTLPTPNAMALSAPIPNRPEVLLIDPDAIAQGVAAILRPSLTRADLCLLEVFSQLEKMKLAIVTEVVVALRAEILSGIRVEGLAVVAASSAAGSVAIEDNVPVFVPSKIGRDDLIGDVVVEATQIEGETGVTSAADALRAVRTGKPSKK